MYGKSAVIYDAIYSFKDYADEANTLKGMIARHKRSPGNDLLDVACGTGKHLEYLRPDFTVEGLDLFAEMLGVARQRLPGVPFHQGDMADFDLGRQFDVITCLFSAIGYVKTRDRLDAAVANMARHVKPGGVLLVEPWFAPDTFKPGTVHGRYVDLPDLKIARMNLSVVEGRLSIMDMHHLVATPDGVEYYIERHEMGLFVPDEYRAAFVRAGLAVMVHPSGLDGRGMYIGQKPLG
jgi:SAM-dependent methyltransferase